ncbi:MULTISPECIES: RNA polymerase sigma factor [unclassified Sphingobium]|jgi:RNA polymerase sigma factor (sigma-70 family)|uniref:RNA polymerase sigma factor n=1 Tax=unclassified Sphingobium TaxID=2611147 RepID=UPI0004C43E41|nr:MULTISPECIES: RNA polymerase sigma factor [unclassified Sphingobium]MBS89672.1 RNA polymerase sigma factor [Sphingobium sp.]
MIDDSEPLKPPPANEFDASLHESGQSPVQQLLALLEIEYATLLARLSAHFRSPEAAAEALHDVYVKLRADPSIGDLHSPRSYLYRMAVNLAKNRSRSDWRTVHKDDAELSEFPDGAPDQEAVVLATDEMSRALQALHALPIRRQAIFLAKWRDEKTQGEIAAEFGLHKRSVQKELARAEKYLRKVLRRPRQPL